MSIASTGWQRELPRTIARGSFLFLALAAGLAGNAAAWQAAPDTTYHPPTMDARARIVEHDSTAFGADPTYEGIAYDFQAQLDIYGANYLN